jgi:hypothetical protein
MPKRVVLFGIEPKSIETGLEMSEEVGGAIGRLADMVALELASLGLDVTSKMQFSHRDTETQRKSQSFSNILKSGMVKGNETEYCITL